MIRMPCKSPFLQHRHLLTKCHIITLRGMQKIKMNTNTPNKNEHNTKNTLASGPSRPTPVVGQASMSAMGLARPMSTVVWSDPLAWVSLAVTRGDRLKPAMTCQNSLQNSILTPKNP
jgi:hypothetical protein